MNYLIFTIISAVLSAFFTLIVMRLAIKFDITDKPDNSRKIHNKNIPLLGGIAIFLAFFITLFIARVGITAGNLEISHWVGFFVGGLILIIGGFLDDKFNLPAKVQIIFPILAVGAIIFGGINVEKITNPFGDFFYISEFLSIFFIATWLLIVMYTTKLLDGVDGLVSGFGVIGGLVIFLFTITTRYFQPDIALACAIFTGASFGFLIFNWHPAKIFLGEGGSLFIGYVLAVMAIISGGKIAIAFLILGIPILDVFWTILRRLLKKQNPFNFSDKLHLHHRLLDLGLSQRKTVLIFYSISFIFGISALFLQSIGKIFAILSLVLLMFILISLFNFLDNKKGKI